MDDQPPEKKLKNLPPISSKRLEEIKSIKDEDIDYSDIPELDDRFWKNAKVTPPRIQINTRAIQDKKS